MTGFTTHYRGNGIDLPKAWVVIETNVGDSRAVIGYRIYPSKAYFDETIAPTPIDSGNVHVQDHPAYEQTFTDTEGTQRTERMAEVTDYSDHFHHTKLASDGNHPLKAAEAYLKKNAPWLPTKTEANP